MPKPSGKYGLVISYSRSRKRRARVKRLNESYKFGIKNIKRPQTLACKLCSSTEVNDLDLGELLTNENITVHYFCLLLASGLYQNGRMSDKKAIKGFLKQDIIREAKRGRRLKCCYCRGKGATIGCCMTACKKVFHLPCGRSHGTLHHFFDTFGSFCELHRPQQRVSVSDRLSFRGTAKATCAICLTAVDARSSTETIRSPCCKNSWFHHSCMQKYAVSAGQYFFKCPVCSSNRSFQSEMLNFGIYIPVQDASWEREPNAYGELLVRHSSCDAPQCKCPQGRNFDAEMGEFDLILCEFCGSFGTHVACRGLTLVGNYRLCPLCSATDGETDVTMLSDNAFTCETKQPEPDIDVDIDGHILRSRIVRVSQSSHSVSTCERKQPESDINAHVAVEGHILRSRVVPISSSDNVSTHEKKQLKSDIDVNSDSEGIILRSRSIDRPLTRSRGNTPSNEMKQRESDSDCDVGEGHNCRSRSVSVRRTRDNASTCEINQLESATDVDVVRERHILRSQVAHMTRSSDRMSTQLASNVDIVGEGHILRSRVHSRLHHRAVKHVKLTESFSSITQ